MTSSCLRSVPLWWELKFEIASITGHSLLPLAMLTTLMVEAIA